MTPDPQRPSPERLPRKSASPLLWTVMLIAAAAVLAALWNLLAS